MKLNKIQSIMTKGLAMAFLTLLIPLGAWAQTDYGVSVGGTAITSENASSLFNGTVSYDETTATLTLNGATLGVETDGHIETSHALTINLVGENTLNGYIAYISTMQTEEISLSFTGTGSLHLSYNDGSLITGFASVDFGEFNILSSPPGGITYQGADGLQYADGNTVYDISLTTRTVYPIWVIDVQNNNQYIQVTGENKSDILGNGKIKFDGDQTITLNNATIDVYEADNAFIAGEGVFGLTINLIGSNQITDGMVVSFKEESDVQLTFTTNPSVPGSLTKTMARITNIENVVYEKGLICSDEASSGGYYIHYASPMSTIVDENAQSKSLGDGTGLGDEIDDITNTDVTENPTGIVRNNVLYTLGDDDGNYEEGDIKWVSIETSTDDVPANQPGTTEFAAAFKGMTMLLPAGTGTIEIEYRTLGATQMVVKVGDVEHTFKSDPDEAVETVTIPYAVSEATYVYIFNRNLPSSAPAFDLNRAPGRRLTGTTQLKRASVTASSVAPAPTPPLTPKTLEKADVSVAGGHIIVNDPDVIGLADDVFEGITELTYVDLTGTAITGLIVDRTAKPFSDLPASAFVYLPVGNNVKDGTKNVVIGTVCADMLLSDAAFEAAANFTAVKAEQSRDYSAFVGKNCTIYLPFAIDVTTAASLGKFYQLSSIDATKAEMNSVESTSANTPYMFKPAVAKVSAEMVDVKTLVSAPSPDSPFKGTYQSKGIVSGTANYYCFVGEGTNAGKFVRVVTNEVTVAPFRAYMEVAASSSHELQLIFDGDATGIRNMKVGTEENVYYGLQGRRVLYPTKGLYIVNGKKVIVK